MRLVTLALRLVWYVTWQTRRTDLFVRIGHPISYRALLCHVSALRGSLPDGDAATDSAALQHTVSQRHECGRSMLGCARRFVVRN